MGSRTKSFPCCRSNCWQCASSYTRSLGGDQHCPGGQFYINIADNTPLDRANAAVRVGYCVFGKVTAGMDVVDRISVVKTARGDKPVEDVIIESVRKEMKK